MGGKMSNKRPIDRVGLRVKSDASGVACDLAHLIHYEVAAADAVAASANGVKVANMAAAAQDITAGIVNPATPRALSIAGNVSGITGNVVITGTNYAGETISETIALNGTSTVHGSKAFKTITNIHLPARVHTEVAQVETATVVGTITAAGNATVTVTAAGLDGGAKAIDVAVALDDNANAIATKIRAALTADADISALFMVSGAGALVTLTAKTPAADDATLNIAVADNTSTGITEDATSDAIAAGVPYDIVSVGWNDKLGIPFKLEHNTVLNAFLGNVLEGTAPTVTTSTSAMESNTVDLNSALNGSAVDIYLIAVSYTHLTLPTN
jgi:hypothetical protein